MRAWLVSIHFCLWNSGKCLKACVCVCEILVLLLFPQAHIVPEPESSPIGPPSAYLSGLLHTLCPPVLVTCLTCSTGLDHTPSYIPAPHLHCTEWHFCKYTHTHTHVHMQLHASLFRKQEFERAGSPAQWPFICSAVCVRRADDWLLCH